MTGDRLALDVALREEDLNDAVVRAKTFLQGHGLSPEIMFKIRMAIEELLTNVYKYAHDNPSGRSLRLELTVSPDEVGLRCEDDGKYFDPVRSAEPDLARPLSERPVGGLGIHLIKHYAAGMTHRRECGRNILELKFRR